MRNWSRSLPGRDCSSYFPPKPTPHRHRTRKVCSTDCSIKQVSPCQLNSEMYFRMHGQNLWCQFLLMFSADEELVWNVGHYVMIYYVCTCNYLNIYEYAKCCFSTGSTEVKARAVLCPLTSKGQPISMCYRTLNIGTGQFLCTCTV